MAIRKIGDWYYVYYKVNGLVRSKSLGTKDCNEAKSREKSFMKNLSLARLELRTRKACGTILGVDLELNRKQNDKINQGTFFSPAQLEKHAEYLASGKGRKNDNDSKIKLTDVFELAKKHRHNVAKRHQQAINSFIEWSKLEYVHEVTPKIALQFLEDNYRSKKAKTYNNMRVCLNVLFKSILIEAELDQSPFENIPARELSDTTHHRNFTREECQLIIDNAEPYWKTLSVLALYTGQRLETCRRISPSHITSDGMITIMPGKTARFGRAVKIPIVPALQKYLDTIPVSEDKTKPYCDYFPSKNKASNACTLYFGKLLDRLGIKDENGEKASFHSFRCSFITIMCENNIPERVIRGIVGHTATNMTDLYNHDTESAKAILNVSFESQK